MQMEGQEEEREAIGEQEKAGDGVDE